MTALRIVEADDRPFYTPKTLAQKLAISERTMYAMLMDGSIPSYKIAGERRIYEDDVNAYLKSVRNHRQQWPAREPRIGYNRWEVDEQDYAVVLRSDPCVYCDDAAAHVDHIVPLARGGKHAWDNLTSACRRCNSAKQARSLLTFLRGRIG